ncbi:MAG: OmpW family protein [Methylotenera sp.]|nr:outer membrane beta-barrel protein [Methylotenera sp.]MDD4926476.1 outer membrane beta-barrel protein [Methylotenera sp.]NOS95972.1 OmpW family protein [Methylotenera sp.]
MKKSVLVLAIAAAFAPVLAQAEAGDFVVRARVVNINPDEDSKLGKTVNNLGLGTLIGQGAELKVDSNTIPEFDVSYYVTKNIALELILATGSKHDVSITGSSAANTIPNQLLGSVDVLPPTLTVQWHFNPDQTFDPYVGAGVNYTAFLDKKLNVRQGGLAGYKIQVDSDSWGYALQAGLDVNLKDGWLINADIKYVTIDTDVELKGAATGNRWTKIDSLDINPWVFGVGIGKKF